MSPFVLPFIKRKPLSDGQDEWPLYYVTSLNKLSAYLCLHLRGEKKAFHGPPLCWYQPTTSLF